MTSRTSGDAKWMAAPVTVKPATKYVVSDWYISDVRTSLEVVYTNAAGKHTFTWLSDAAAVTWRQLSVEKAPNAVHTVTATARTAANATARTAANATARTAANATARTAANATARTAANATARTVANATAATSKVTVTVNNTTTTPPPGPS